MGVDTYKRNGMRVTVILFFLLAGMEGCRMQQEKKEEIPQEEKSMEGQKEIYLAGGCFWGTEHFMKQIRGVESTRAGYANSSLEKPTYQQVCSGRTGAAEAVQVVYDPEKVGLPLLLELYLKTIDPTSLNRQGNDRGTQYRTGIYYTDVSDRPVIETALNVLSLKYDRPLAVEAGPLINFYPAEGYHQDYLEKNQGGYCQIDPVLFQQARDANRLADVPEAVEKRVFTRPGDAVLKERLTPLQYAVTQMNATETPFRNAYWDENREGIYVDITTGEPLFVSADKFESGCGWPSFSKPIRPDVIEERSDASHGMRRTEVRSKTGNAHLGHVFTDGPQERGGLRYCINSASLRFIPKDEMEKEGYGEYLSFLGGRN